MAGSLIGRVCDARGNRRAMVIEPLHWCDEAVAQARTRLNESRALRWISEDTAKLVYRRIQAVVEGHVRIGPQFFAKRLSPYHLSGAFDQSLENLEGFFFQLNAHAVFTKLPQFEGDFEGAEAHKTSQVFHVSHGLHRGISLASTQVARRSFPFLLSF
jgi:hypothetical protein